LYVGAVTGAWEADSTTTAPFPSLGRLYPITRAGASYSHDTTKEMVSFDGEEIAKLEGKYIEWTGVKGIGGREW